MFDKKVIGKIGIEALIKKVVRVNEAEIAEDAAKMYLTTVDKMIKEKADALGFRAEL